MAKKKSGKKKVAIKHDSATRLANDYLDTGVLDYFYRKPEEWLVKVYDALEDCHNTCLVLDGKRRDKDYTAEYVKRNLTEVQIKSKLMYYMNKIHKDYCKERYKLELISTKSKEDQDAWQSTRDRSIYSSYTEATANRFSNPEFFNNWLK